MTDLKFYMLVPPKAGFYRFNLNEKAGEFEVCKYADSKQISKSMYKLQEDIFYRSISGKIYHVKKGFLHDGASKGFLKHFGKYTNAAILHDALYGSNIVSRKEADKLFLEAMKVSKVNSFKTYTYYSAVWVFGWLVYDKKSKKTIENNLKFISIYEEEKR